MKKALSLILALALCLALAVPALAVESRTANLTPEAAAAYKGVVDELYAKYGAPTALKSHSGTTQPYTGMCGGYVIDLGDGGCPELIVAYSKYTKKGVFDNFESYIKVYTWNGTSAVQAHEQRVLASGNGRTWASYSLWQSGDTAWLDETWETLPSYNYSTGQMIDGSKSSTHYHMANGKMTKFTPRDEADSSFDLGSYDYIYLNNYDELIAALSNAGGSAPGGSAPAGAGPAVTVGGKAVAWPDATPFIDGNGRTMVPLRAVADNMALTVSWDAAAREASFTDGSKTITFPIGSTTARTDGGSIQMDTAAVIVGGRTFAPVRYLAEYFGHEVGWDAATKTVIID